VQENARIQRANPQISQPGRQMFAACSQRPPFGRETGECFSRRHHSVVLPAPVLLSRRPDAHRPVGRHRAPTAGGKGVQQHPGVRQELAQQVRRSAAPRRRPGNALSLFVGLQAVRQLLDLGNLQKALNC